MQLRMAVLLTFVLALSANADTTWEREKVAKSADMKAKLKEADPKEAESLMKEHEEKVATSAAADMIELQKTVLKNDLENEVTAYNRNRAELKKDEEDLARIQRESASKVATTETVFKSRAVMPAQEKEELRGAETNNKIQMQYAVEYGKGAESHLKREYEAEQVARNAKMKAALREAKDVYLTQAEYQGQDYKQEVAAEFKKDEKEVARSAYKMAQLRAELKKDLVEVAKIQSERARKVARAIVEKYYAKLTLDFEMNKKTSAEEVATSASKMKAELREEYEAQLRVELQRDLDQVAKIQSVSERKVARVIVEKYYEQCIIDLLMNKQIAWQVAKTETRARMDGKDHDDLLASLKREYLAVMARTKKELGGSNAADTEKATGAEVAMSASKNSELDAAMNRYKESSEKDSEDLSQLRYEGKGSAEVTTEQQDTATIHSESASKVAAIESRARMESSDLKKAKKNYKTQMEHQGAYPGQAEELKQEYEKRVAAIESRARMEDSDLKKAKENYKTQIQYQGAYPGQAKELKQEYEKMVATSAAADTTESQKIALKNQLENEVASFNSESASKVAATETLFKSRADMPAQGKKELREKKEHKKEHKTEHKKLEKKSNAADEATEVGKIPGDERRMAGFAEEMLKSEERTFIFI